MLALLQQNLRLNGFQERGSVQRLEWRSWRTGHPGLGSFDLLLGADLLYASAHVKVCKPIIASLQVPCFSVSVKSLSRQALRAPDAEPFFKSNSLAVSCGGRRWVCT